MWRRKPLSWGWTIPKRYAPSSCAKNHSHIFFLSFFCVPVPYWLCSLSMNHWEQHKGVAEWRCAGATRALVQHQQLHQHIFQPERLRHHFQDGLFQVRFDTLLPIPPKNLIHSFLFRSTAPLCSVLLVSILENEKMDLSTAPRRKVQTLLTKK